MVLNNLNPKKELSLKAQTNRSSPISLFYVIILCNLGLPTEAYKVVEEIHDDGTPTNKTFEHVATEIGAEEAEEVGVEHLLRWVNF